MKRSLWSILTPAAVALASMGAAPARIVPAAQAPAAPTAARAQPFVVIVHSSNPAQSLTRDQVSRLFLKKTSRWQSGREAMPVDLAGRPQTRVAFTELVHRKSVVSVNSYWQQQLFAGKDVPPPAMSSERDVVEFVRATPDAIGYVSSKSELGRSIKVLTVVD